MTYTIYHVPGVKIGVTINVKNRVEEQQGYKPNEYEILETSDDLDYISKPGKKGQQRKDSSMRIIFIPPYKDPSGWSIEKYKNRWDIIEDLLN